MLCNKVEKNAVVDIEKKVEDLKVEEEGSKFECPFEDVDNADPFASEEPCKFHRVVHRRTAPRGTEIAGKDKSRGGYIFSRWSGRLLQDIGGGDRLRQMTTRFYAHCFRDHTLRKFMFEDDGSAAHGQRLADWMVEMMGGEGTPWRDSGRFGNMRQLSHSKAWHSERRPKKDRGKRFQLDDCRIWMRLMFLSGREVGLDQFTTFWRWYSGMIQEFIGIYEFTAPPYTQESLEWSEDPANVDKYKADGCKMVGVIGAGRR